MVNYPRRNRTGLRRWIPSFWQLLSLAILGFVSLAVALAIAVRVAHLPEPNELAQAQASIFYWDDGKTELARIGEANRTAVTIDQIPLDTQRAVLAAEDRSFYQHGGFSPKGIGRALWSNISGGSTQGGSTITQQYAKNAFLNQGRTYSRKLSELVLSIKIETQVSKDQILERYLNTIYFGRGCYGIQTAAKAYFGVPVWQLNDAQSAVLAALIQAPSGLAPENDLPGLKYRWNYVLDGMVTQGWLDSAKRDTMHFPAIKKYKIRETFGGTRGYLVEQARSALLKLGVTEDRINRGGLRVTTTFNRQAQVAAVSAVQIQGPKSNTQGLRIGLASVRPGTGEVVAIYGGADYLKNQLNNATQAIGQGGSTFKAFTLAAAFENNVGIYDTFSGQSGTNVDGYRVVNEFGQNYGSRISVVRAAEQSVNSAFVQMAARVGNQKVMEAAFRAGIPKNTVGVAPNLTFTLGTASPHVVDEAAAYATFAARGKQIGPSYIREILDPQGEVIFKLDPQPVQAFTNDVADKVTYTLQQVVRNGTGRAALALGRPAAGKTGTTDSNKSAWFSGYTPQLATSVMLVKEGPNGQAISLSGTGGMSQVFGASFPCRIWTEYMKRALDGQPTANFAPIKLPKPTSSPTVTTSPTSSPTGSTTGEPTVSPTESQIPSVIVPNLTGKLETARDLATSLGLTLIQQPIDSSVNVGKPLFVVRQNPQAGSFAPVGSSIVVQVSNKKP